MKNKNGITLVMLAITVMTLLILASVVVYLSADAVNNSRLAAYSSDLTQIEDLVGEYYLTNNELPKATTVAYTKAQVIALVSDGSNVLSQEITENGDDSDTFYKVQLEKLPISDAVRGIQMEGDSTDVYIVASKSLHVYYLKGEKIAGDYYFSLTKRLTGKSRVNSDNAVDSSDITISTVTSGIKLTKSTSEWTNDLNITLETTLATGEDIECLVAAGATTVKTANTNYTIKLADILNTYEATKNSFYANEENKMLVVNKYNNLDELIATASIDVSNLDILSGTPVASSNITYEKNSGFILATVNGYTDLGGSGVKEARVLYTTKLDASGNTVPYYDSMPSTITAEYVNNSGKVSNPNIIKLPSDVTGFAVVFIDNAGNVSDVASYTVTY